MSKQFEIALLGPVSRDFNIEPDGSCVIEVGGAIVYSPYAARTAGANCIAVVKGGADLPEVRARFADFDGELRLLPGEKMTSIENRYFDLSHEQRSSSLKSQADPFSIDDLTGISADIYHLGGLVVGDFSDAFVRDVAKQGETALDVQCVLRHGIPGAGEMTYEDWVGKRDVLPTVTYLKADAKEALILTGTEDRHKGARMLQGWGPREVFISYHNQMLVYDGRTFYECDYEPLSLAGRTGRGDTVFAAYLGYRLRHDIAEALRLSTALVVLKMQKIGPYMGTPEEVRAYADSHLSVRVVPD